MSQSPAAIAEETTTPAEFFGEAYETFQRAEQAAGPVERCYAIGGYVVRLRFAGPALVPLVTPALAHLAVEPVEAPALTICLWDRASTNTVMPAPPWGPDDVLARGKIRGFNNQRFQTAYRLGLSLFSMLDHERNLGLYWTDDARQFIYHERSFPMRTLFNWWMLRHGRQLTHAAAVGTPAGGVLITGKSGVGKSTTALACLRSELFYVGDDHVLVGHAPGPFAFSLYNSAKLNAHHVEKFPHLLPAISNPDELDTQKALLFLHDHYPEKMIAGVPVQAILIPRVTGQCETRLQRISPATSLTALGPSTLFLMPGSDREIFQNLVSFVRQVPNYRLELGTELAQIPDVIAQLLREGTNHATA